MTFCHRNEKESFLLRRRAITAFLSQKFMITYLSIVFEDLLAVGAASYALGVKESNFAAKNASPFSYLLRVRAEGVQSLLCWSWKIAVGRNKSTQASVLLCLFCHLSVLEGFGGQSQSYMSRARTTFLRLQFGTVSS